MMHWVVLIGENTPDYFVGKRIVLAFIKEIDHNYDIKLLDSRRKLDE